MLLVGLPAKPKLLIASVRAWPASPGELDTREAQPSRAKLSTVEVNATLVREFLLDSARGKNPIEAKRARAT